MCGLWGLIDNAHTRLKGKKHSDFMRTMLVAGSLRGEDGTGIFGVGKQEPLAVIKAPIPGYNFKDTAAYRNFEYINDFYNVIVGHNRWATVGTVSASTTHPFTEGNITLVHNGTLRYSSSLPGYNVCDVDSQQIAYAIDKEGIEVVEDLDGAFALVIYNEIDDTLQIIRNEERPLWWAMSPDYQQMYYASEPNMLQMALARNNIAWCPENGITPFAKDVLYTFDIQEKGVVQWTERKMNLGKRLTVVQKLIGGGTSTGTKTTNDAGGDRSFLAGFQAWLKGEGTFTKKEKKLYTKFYTRKKLKEYGLSEGKTVYFYLKDYALYPNSKVKGRIKGITVVPSNVDIVAHNYTPEDGKVLAKSDSLMKAKVGGIDITSQDKDAITVRDVVQLAPDQESEYWEKVFTYQDDNNTVEIEAAARENVDLPPFDIADDDDNSNIEMFVGPRGKYYSKEEFLNLVPIGCVQCSEVLDENDALHILWDDTDQPFCSDCVEHLVTRGQIQH